MSMYKLLACLITLILPCSMASAFTMTFDDIPSEKGLGYYCNQYDVVFHKGFRVTDHSAASWGLPHSGANVLTFSPGTRCKPEIEFGEANQYSVTTFGGYFSTQSDVIIRLLGYNNGTDTPITSVIIGASGESWSNRYVEISSEAGNIDYVKFECISSTGAITDFCVDDITIIPKTQ